MEPIVSEDGRAAPSLADHEARNAELLRALADAGVALEQPRAIDVCFWSAERDAAEALAGALRSIGATDVTQDSAAGVVAVQGTLWLSPRTIAEPAFTAILVRLGAKYRSAYDGWGTIVADERPAEAP